MSIVRSCSMCFFFQAEDGIRDLTVTGVQTCALPIYGAKFLNFLKTELIPFMETNYRGDPARRILGGHSLGGLFTLYAMFSDPSLFWGYLAGSPAIPWDNNFTVRQEEEFAKNHKDLPVRLFFAVGGAEPLVTPDVSFMQ